MCLMFWMVFVLWKVGIVSVWWMFGGNVDSVVVVRLELVVC